MSNSLITTRLLLNNWHYIKEKTLSFHEEINFFTGHSGSGKSTVIDALQLLLYADTDGRGFFNKAAKDDSNRTLMEYLRGMNNVQENGTATYLRNKNFSSTIALEFLNSETKEYQTIGVAFDVDVTANNIERMFFFHKGELLEHNYRYEGKTMTLSQLKEYLQRSKAADDWWISRTNDKFRSRLYETYLGGLDERKFPMLFKKAISFRMDTKLEDFVKEFICVEKDIHIEDMQESVVQYVRLKRKLEDTKKEIVKLEAINEQYEVYASVRENTLQAQYNVTQLELDLLNESIERNQVKQSQVLEDIAQLTKIVESLDCKAKDLETKRVEVKTAIKNSGYDHLVSELTGKEELLQHVEKSKLQLDRITAQLEHWVEVTEFLTEEEKQSIISLTFEEEDDFASVKAILERVHTDIEEERGRYAREQADMEKNVQEMEQAIAQLEAGQKVYPKYLLEAKDYIEDNLEKKTGRKVPVEILADLIEVEDETWLNAVEGFMSNHKLKLVVAPEYVKEAMQIFEQLDPKRYHKVAMIDTENVLVSKKEPLRNALSEEVSCNLPYVRAYVDFLMGAVIKCNSLEELRKQRSGITKECLLYHGFSMQHLDPKHYEQFAYIGCSAIERRLQRLEKELHTLLEQKQPIDKELNKLRQYLTFEYLTEPYTKYKDLRNDTMRVIGLQQEMSLLTARIEELKTRDLSKWKKEEQRLEEESKVCGQQLSEARAKEITKKNELELLKKDFLDGMERYEHAKASFQYDTAHDECYRTLLQKNTLRLDRLQAKLYQLIANEKQQLETQYETLVQIRDDYRQNYAYRGFSTTTKDNTSYEQLLEKLQSDQLQEFTIRAAEQAKKATSHFKTDFVYKIRDAIKEAMEQKDDLNQILKKTDFGKEKYRFVIEKNKGEDGKFFSMFMDENLEINPNRLSNHMDNQMDLFSTNHEEEYSDLINELLDIFMPPEDSDPLALEEARKNIEKYADYRTYLSFDMEQIIEGMPPMRLSKMLTKNSGGEGQNPLYVALLASFAMVYRINLRKNMRRRLTPRLVILDEAFSKMDGEKVASCVELIRKLGFQAIISATNDKIQNYVESVDKTFVFANPNKSYISIQSFEKREFGDLLELNAPTEATVEPEFVS